MAPLWAQFGMPGGGEMIIIMIVALLLFGNRLPQVARSVGRSFMEFKKGLQGIEDELRSAATETTKPTPQKSRENEEDKQTNPAPKFVPPSAEPQEEPASQQA
ncbi:Sec-independent protein translocase subunit TatA/TatB [Thermopirellula anaerolimosa]